MKNVKNQITNECHNPPQKPQDYDIRRKRRKWLETRNLIAVRWLLFTAYCLIPISYCLQSGCCGYSTRSLLPGYIKKIHIKIFDNQTIKTGLDETATQATIDAFRSGSGLRIVDEKQADIIIEGTVSDYNKEPYVYTGALNITQYKITVKFSVRCIDQIKNSVFWEGDVAEWATYTTNEDDGIKAAIQKTAEKLVTTILTNW